MPNIIVDPQPEPLVSAEPVSVNSFFHNFPKSIMVGILFILLSLTAYGAYWYTKNYLVIPPSQSAVSNLNNKATPVVTDETINWKTYKNEKLGFLLKYPLDWQVKNIEYQSTGPTDTAPSFMGIGFFPKVPKPANDSYTMYVAVSNNPNGLNLADAVKDWYSYDTKSVALSNAVLNSKDILVDVVIGKKVVNPPIDTAGLPTTWVLVKNKDKIYRFSVILDKSYPEIDKEKLFDQILSTFKFLDSPAAEVVVEFPQPDSFVVSPLLIRGKIVGSWMLEGSFSIVLLDENRKEIARSLGEEVNKGSWTSGGMVEFRSQISFDTKSKSGYLVLRKSNPSGLLENDKIFEIPLSFSNK